MKYWLIPLLVASVHSAGKNQSTDLEDCVPDIKSCTGVSFSSSEYIDVEFSDECVADSAHQHLVDSDEALSKCGPYNVDIRELTISEISEHFRIGKLTSLELTRCYLHRISKMDVYLRSVIEVNLDAIPLARRADIESSVSRIHGVPILLKDNIGTDDSMQTTVGSLALEDVKPMRDADVVERLRKAGAIILGKASLSEWANFRGNIPSGWNGRRGQTVSSYVLSQNPSGSSSGSAVSAIVGLKPTLGAVSIKGIIPLAFSNDVVGPMVRSVEDASILMAVISDIDLQGCDLNISTCLEQRKLKIGVLREPFWNRSDVNLAPIIPILEKCLDKINKTGMAIVVDPVTVPFVPIDRQNANVVYRHEFKYSLNNYLTNFADHRETDRNISIYSLTDVIKFNELNPPNECYNQNTLLLAEATNGLRNKTYISSLHEYRTNSIRYLDSVFDESGVDALATPCNSNNTPLLYSHGAAAGYPSITVPVSTYNVGLPFGLCLLGRPFSEAVLLKLGYFIEHSRPGGRPTPRFV